jgi:hypothetical protein
MEECVRMMQQSLRGSPSIKKRAKSVYHQRNLGTIKERKKEKKQEKEVSNGETVMRILRMRCVSDIPFALLASLTRVLSLQTQYVGIHRPATPDYDCDAGRARAAGAAKPAAEGTTATTGSAGNARSTATIEELIAVLIILRSNDTYHNIPLCQ